MAFGLARKATVPARPPKTAKRRVQIRIMSLCLQQKLAFCGVRMPMGKKKEPAFGVGKATKVFDRCQ